jgi:hypothetical protein
LADLLVKIRIDFLVVTVESIEGLKMLTALLYLPQETTQAKATTTQIKAKRGVTTFVLSTWSIEVHDLLLDMLVPPAVSHQQQFH